jgi:hypothetical protein
MQVRQDNVLRNQQISAQTRLLNAQAMKIASSGIPALGGALRQMSPEGQRAQESALGRAEAGTRLAQAEADEADHARVSRLLQGVASLPEEQRAAARALGVQEYEKSGGDIPEGFETYTPQGLQTLQGIYSMPAEELTDWQRKMAMLGSPEERMRATRIALDLEAPASAEAKPTSLQQRALDAGLQPGTEPYKQFMLDGGRQKTSKIVYGQDGQPIVYEGAADGAPKPLREFEAKAVQFNTRMVESLPRVEASEKAIEEKGGVSIWDQATSSEMGKRFGGNFLTSNEFQTYQGAAREWIAGLLRLDSGAAVPETEFVRYFSTFFYEAGDNEKTRANKRSAREATMKALQQIVPPDRQGQKATTESDGPAKSADQLTEEELAAEAKSLGIDY